MTPSWISDFCSNCRSQDINPYKHCGAKGKWFESKTETEDDSQEKTNP